MKEIGRDKIVKQKQYRNTKRQKRTYTESTKYRRKEGRKRERNKIFQVFTGHY